MSKEGDNAACAGALWSPGLCGKNPRVWRDEWRREKCLWTYESDVCKLIDIKSLNKFNRPYISRYLFSLFIIPKIPSGL